MQRFTPLLALTAFIAGPVSAQDKPADLPRQYEALKPVTIAAAAGNEKIATSDPLTDTRKIALSISFKCASDTCADAGLRFIAADEAGEGPEVAFSARDGALAGALRQGETAAGFDMAPKAGETFDLRLYWSNGNRLTADLYRRDPVSGRETMESRQVRLTGDVHSLITHVTGGELTIVRQAYTFR